MCWRIIMLKPGITVAIIMQSFFFIIITLQCWIFWTIRAWRSTHQRNMCTSSSSSQYFSIIKWLNFFLHEIFCFTIFISDTGIT
uniref:Uncharacterized protein n=1 Tax=Panstrongylus lignarius TaxID=156445 RepID=A0A224XW45_9HEMI